MRSLHCSWDGRLVAGARSLSVSRNAANRLRCRAGNRPASRRRGGVSGRKGTLAEVALVRRPQGLAYGTRRLPLQRRSFLGGSPPPPARAKIGAQTHRPKLWGIVEPLAGLPFGLRVELQIDTVAFGCLWNAARTGLLDKTRRKSLTRMAQDSEMQAASEDYSSVGCSPLGSGCLCKAITGHEYPP